MSKEIKYLDIHTINGKEPGEDKEYIYARVTGCDEHLQVVEDFGSCKIKVRGNSTAKGKKKPYSLKFDKKVSFFDFPKAKRWILLADYYDPTLQHNYTALDLAEELELPFTMKHHWVPLYINDKFKGLYLLTEKIEISKKRVDINPDAGDFLIELERPSRVEKGETYIKAGDLFFHLREADQYDEDDIPAIERTMRDYITRLKAGDYELVKECIDIDSFAKYYIINELMKTCDFHELSVYFYQKKGKLYAGPAWDYDLSGGLYFKDRWSSWRSWAATAHLYKYLWMYTGFKERVANIYHNHEDYIKSIYKDGGIIDQRYKKYKFWIDKSTTLGLTYCDTNYEYELEYFKKWLSERNAWLCKYLDVASSKDKYAGNMFEYVPSEFTKKMIGCDGYYTIKGNNHYFVKYDDGGFYEIPKEYVIPQTTLPEEEDK